MRTNTGGNPGKNERRMIMTTTVLARGSDWGIFANHGVYANWGECGDGADFDKTYKMLGDLVIDRFHALCAENDIHAVWSPYTSEVIGDIDQNLDEKFPEDSDGNGVLDQLRIQAAEEIWGKWTNGEIEPVMTVNI